jgi:zinc transport system permease protein
MFDIMFEPFFVRSLLGGLLIALMAPLLGMFIVLRRQSMIGDTLAHVTIAGVALGLLIETYPLLLGIVFAVLASFAIEQIRKIYKTYAELSIAIILSGGVAFATFLFTLGKGFNINVMSYLFGSIYTLDRTDLWVILIVTVIVCMIIMTYFKELMLMTFDEDAAKVNGLPVRRFNLMLTVLVALVVSVAIKIVGALLVSALLIIPVATSLLISRGFKHAMLLSVLFSEIAVVSGLMIAGVWNMAPGGTVVLTAITMLVTVMVVKRGFKI